MGADQDELVILVHGTGASQRGPKGEERWWQPESAFAQEMLSELSSQASGDAGREFRLEAFVWSGANSERERRIAGQTLAKRLKDLEARRIPFHLVGHSHGGSVIWHALRRMLREERPKSLRSWTTVGTPFLTFGDRGAFYLLLFLSLSLFTAGMTYILLGSLPPLYWTELGRVVRDAPLPALLGVAAGGAVTLAVVAYSLVVLTLQLWRRVRSRSRRLSADDAVFLGERWLPLAHPEDEPINALRASVIQPAEPFMPRLKAGLGARQAGTFENSSGNGPGGGKPARPPITPSTVTTAMVSRVAAPFYNMIVAPLLDQFLWETAKQVAQGKDVPGEYLIRCDRAPPELLGYWKEATPDFLTRLSTLADSAAAGTARNIRSRLAAIGEGTSSVSVFSSALSWREVIHTAYFEPGCGVAAVVARRIIEHDKVVGAAPAAAACAPSAEPASRNQRVFRPRYLYLALTGAAAALCTAASFSTVAVERAWLWPYTNAFQIDQIYRSLFDARSTSLRLMNGLDKILVRWVLLDRTEEAISTALRLEDTIRYMGANARLERLQDIAFAIGAKGSAADLTLLLSRNVCAESEESCLEGLSKEEVTAYLLAHAAAGSRAAGNGAHGLAEKKLDEIVKANRGTWSGGYITRVMLHAGAFEPAERFAEGDSSFCDGVRKWASESPYGVPTDRIPGKLRDCLDQPLAAYVDEPTYTYQNHFSLPATILRRVIKGLPGAEAKSCRSELLGAVHAMNRCEEDRENLTPVSAFEDEQQQPELRYDPAKPAHELLREISLHGYRNGNYLPSCLPPLENRISDLQLCLRPIPPFQGVASEEDRLSWWTSHVWKAGAGKQTPICGEENYTLGRGYGRKMQEIVTRLGELAPRDLEKVKRLVTLRTNYEIRQRQFTNPASDDGMTILDSRCGWAGLALAWTWLGNEMQSTKLLDAVLPKESPASGTQILDLYLGIADALAERAPAQAKRFLDRSFDLVDDNDPALFFKTSDGSLDETFAYRKSDIARLYAEIGEYRLAAATNDRVNQFSEDSVSAYLTILDSEIRRARRYGDGTLKAVLESPRPPGFRLQ